jgi:carbon storage regulator
MLILARRINETIMIGDQIEVSIVDIRGDQVKIGIRAPRTVKVYRKEVYQLIQDENLKAAQTVPGSLPRLDSLMGKGNAPDAPHGAVPDAPHGANRDPVV